MFKIKNYAVGFFVLAVVLVSSVKAVNASDFSDFNDGFFPSYDYTNDFSGLTPSYDYTNDFSSYSPSYDYTNDFSGYSPSYDYTNDFSGYTPGYDYSKDFTGLTPGYDHSKDYSNPGYNYSKDYSKDGYNYSKDYSSGNGYNGSTGGYSGGGYGGNYGGGSYSAPRYSTVPVQQLQRLIQQQVAYKSTPVYYPTPTPTPCYTCTQPIPQPQPVCTVNIYPTTATVVKGQAVTISWSSSNASYVTLTGGTYNNTRVNNSGSYTVYPQVNTTYTVKCFTAYGQTNIASSYISVTQPIYVPPAQNPCYICNQPVYTPPTPTPCYTCSQPVYDACLSVSTTGAVPLTTTASIYGYVNPCYANASIWFDYGTSYSNLQWKTTRQSTSNAGQFSASLSGLSCGTRYYYRAAAQNGFETKYGSTLSFVTNPCPTVTKSVSYNYTYKAPVKTTTTKTTTVKKEAECICDTQQYLVISVEKLEDAVVAGKLANFKITFKNPSKESLKDVALRVTLPDEMVVYSSTAGQYTKSARVVLLTIPEFGASEEGTFVVTTSVNAGAQTGSQMVVNAYGNYTVPTVVKNKVPLKGEVSAYAIVFVGAVANTINQNQNQYVNNGSSVTNSTATESSSSSMFASSLIPGTFVEWLVAIIVLVIFFMALRYIFNAFTSSRSESSGHH